MYLELARVYVLAPSDSMLRAWATGYVAHFGKQDRNVGRWLSSVKRLVWDQETASSNLARPTNTF